MNRKAVVNYIVDLTILIAFVLSAISGMGLMDSHHARSAATGTTTPVAINASLMGTSDLHVLSSFLLIFGVLGHLALHWRWMLAMTRALFG